MTLRQTRRTFLQQTALAGITAPAILTRTARAASSGKLRHAAIGVGRRGQVDLRSLDSHPDVQIVALCDVDARYLAQAAQRHPQARLYRDWRVLLKEEADHIDSVNITIPNHMHAPVALTALRLDKHVYCQKPLTHSIYEARRLEEEAAARPELATQMGVQTHSIPVYRTAVAMVQAGLIGKVKEAHSWDRIRLYYTGAFTDPPMERRPDAQAPVPEYLDWDLWLGVAPERPYYPELYHTQMWRRWLDFGGGAHGDMAGHMMDGVFAALKLTAPEWVLSYRSPPYEELFSPDNKVLYHFPGTEYTDGELDYYWYDTGPIDTTGWPLDEQELAGNGSLLVGEKAFLYLPHIGEPQVLPREENRAAVEEFYRSGGRREGVSHYHEYVDACLGRGTTSTPFRYSGPLTESVLMGTVVNRFPEEKLLWDAEHLEFTNRPEANALLRRDYREGWQVEGLG